MIEVLPVDKPRYFRQFIKLPWKIYGNDPHWVPPLLHDMRRIFNTKKHPFYEYGTIRPYLAFKNREVVGRIAAVDSTLYNKHHSGSTAFFGFFECINDPDVAQFLFAAAVDWCRKRGHKKVIGPASPSSNYDFGLLTKNFEDEPRIMMTYNPPYYADLIEGFGFRKAKELYAYKLSHDKVLANDKLERVARQAQERAGMEIRQMNLKDLANEVAKIKDIYNEAWEPNWGHVPLTDSEIDLFASNLKPVAEQELCLIGYIDNKPMGMAIAIRDFNPVFKTMNGRLFPFNFLKIYKKHSLDWIRIILLGILPEYQRKGLDAVFYYELIKAALAKGIKYGEGSWILEDNLMMRRGLEVVNGEIYKHYAAYELDIPW